MFCIHMYLYMDMFFGKIIPLSSWLKMNSESRNKIRTNFDSVWND